MLRDLHASQTGRSSDLVYIGTLAVGSDATFDKKSHSVAENEWSETLSNLRMGAIGREFPDFYPFEIRLKDYKWNDHGTKYPLCIAVKDTGADKPVKAGMRLHLWSCMGIQNHHLSQVWYYDNEYVRNAMNYDVCIDQKDDTNKLEVWNCKTYDSQRIKWSGDRLQMYKLGNKCIASKDSNPKEGSELVIETCNSDKRQKWEVMEF